MSDNLITVTSVDNLLTVEEITNLFTVDESGNPQLINVTEPPVLLTVREETVNLLSVAAQGPSGTNGTNGTNGIDGTSGDYELLTNRPPLSVVYEFLNSSIIEFDHNMRKYPAIRVEDSAGAVWYGQETFPNLNRVKIVFTVSFSGRIILS